MNTINHIRRLIVFAILALAFLPNAPTLAQHGEWEKAFDVVDQADRAPLTELLNRLVEYEQAQRWDKLYDIVSVEYRRGRNEDDFVRETTSFGYERINIQEFSLKRTYINDPPDGRYTFSGCAIVYWKGDRLTTDANVTVIFESGEWRISEVTMFGSCLPPEMKCKEDDVSGPRP